MRQISAFALLCLSILIVYSSSFPGAFHYDDYALILDNPRVVESPFRYLSFLDHYGGRPLTLWSFHLSYRLFGSDPSAHHWVSVILHVIVSLSLFQLLRRHVSSSSAALAGALLFALHPLQTQAVNYIWSRSMLLMGSFALGSLLIARHHRPAALALFQLAIWSRAEAVVLLPFLILADRTRWRLPVFLTAANLAVFFSSLLLYAPAHVGWRHSDPLSFYLAQPSILLKYLSLMMWPIRLNVDWDPTAPSPAATALASMAIMVLMGAAYRYRKKAARAALGFFWILIWLLPGMALPNNDLLNESRVYVAFAGLAAIFAVFGSWLLQRPGLEAGLRRAAVVALLFSISVPAALLAVGRNRLWTDDVALYRDAAAKSPNKARVRYNLGSALARADQIEEAEREFKAALALEPQDSTAYSALGYCAEIQNRLPEAVEWYRQALGVDPENDYAAQGLRRLEGPEG